MIRTVTQIKEEMADREAIRDCLYRYARAIDRSDAELLRTVYWPEAIDKHLDFSGNVEALIEWVFPKLRGITHAHFMTNILIRLDGPKAAVECYYYYGAFGIQIDGRARDSITGGRYLDRFERRADEWRIAERLVLTDWFREFPDSADWSVGPFGMPNIPRGDVHPHDRSYRWLESI